MFVLIITTQMKNLTSKQLEKLENQIAAISFKLYKVCQQNKVSEKIEQLTDDNFYDYDAQTQEAMMFKLNQVEYQLDELHCMIQTLRENQGA